MTTSYFFANGYYDANADPDAATVVRPQLAFAPTPTPTWKGGWIVSGLAAALAVAALGAVGGIALAQRTETHPAAEPVATSAPAASTPAPLVPAFTASPAIDAPPEPGATRVVVVPAPIVAAVPARPDVPAASPVVTPPPVTSPAPPLGIGICDLVTCSPKPPTAPTPPTPPTNCGIVACHPVPQAPPNPLPSCGDLVACEPN